MLVYKTEGGSTAQDRIGLEDGFTPKELVQAKREMLLHPPSVFLADAKSSERFWELFAANIGNKNRRRADYKAPSRFSFGARGDVGSILHSGTENFVAAAKNRSLFSSSEKGG